MHLDGSSILKVDPVLEPKKCLIHPKIVDPAANAWGDSSVG